MDFITGLTHTCPQHNSTWMKVDMMAKTAHFFLVQTTDSVEDYAKLYILELVKDS